MSLGSILCSSPLGANTNDVSTQGGGGLAKFDKRNGGCMISILKILTKGGGSKIPKIKLMLFVLGLPKKFLNFFGIPGLPLSMSAQRGEGDSKIG